MAWAEKMAQELKKRDNPGMGPYIEGTVVSASPLKISIYDGAAILGEAQLRRVDPWMQCTAYQSCSPTRGATCDYSGGKVLANCAGCSQGKCLTPRPLLEGQEVLLIGRQVYYIIGVVTDA